ncbi:MAG: SpoIIE family protein phosphatase [Vicingaceae bacterium]|nr:SpoIIE family protein phosphatase [Vicingaceae bacterium]
MANTLANLGTVYLEQGFLVDAKKMGLRGFQLAQELGFPDQIGRNARLLTKVYIKEGNYKLAFDMRDLEIQMRDSLRSEENMKATVQQQTKFEYEKQQAIKDAEHEKQIAIEQEEKEKQQIITYATGGGLVLVVLFFIFVFNRLQVTKKQKLIIEEQKYEVESQKAVVEKAHTELEEKNKEITDSITYAKRIQNAILPSDTTVKEYLPNNFVLYLPKDIIAGDFYWMESVSVIANEERVKQSANNEKIASPESLRSQNRNEVILFAAADCTGHGVPGAMVSVVCNNALNRSVREFQLTNPGEILNKTREIVVQEFEKSEEDVKDGMDIALCSLKLSKGSELSESYATLQYAGANNALYIIKKAPPVLPEGEGNPAASQLENKENEGESSSPLGRLGGAEIIEIKPNKQPIGKTDNPQPFTTHNIELQKGDTIYIFTDGFADQFGGEKGKKFMYKPFKELLLSIQDKTMDKQKEILAQHFENWRGNLEQVDDVCVIGVRIGEN